MNTTDLEILSAEDMKSYAYALCVLGTIATGATLGSLAGGTLTLPGAIGGGVFGMFACKTVAEPLKQKLFGSNEIFSRSEFARLVNSIHRENPKMSRGEILNSIAAARLEQRKTPNWTSVVSQAKT